jgi:hypothetical protein
MAYQVCIKPGSKQFTPFVHTIFHRAHEAIFESCTNPSMKELRDAWYEKFKVKIIYKKSLETWTHLEFENKGAYICCLCWSGHEI